MKVMEAGRLLPLLQKYLAAVATAAAVAAAAVAVVAVAAVAAAAVAAVTVAAAMTPLYDPLSRVTVLGVFIPHVWCNLGKVIDQINYQKIIDT